ncbi:MAG: VapC toxin family PIN domain ribonuclease [Micrococcales bacterium]|nr:VapC toxin family PIN domain ribonuclease [Micrococcales bacterium]
MSSTLLRTETIRALRREGLPLASAGPLLDRVTLLLITEPISRVADMIPQPIKTLDALHLAALIQMVPTASLISQDQRQLGVAAELAIAAHDPIMG